MSTGTVGGQSVLKLARIDYTCHIKKIECLYFNDKERKRKAVLFTCESNAKQEPPKEEIGISSDANQGVFLIGNVSYSERRYFFISNYDGKDVKFKCERAAQSCTDSRHASVDIESIDVEKGSIVKYRKPNADLSLNLKYFNLFHTTACGLVTVGFIDLIPALRFILLPKLDESDNEYYCYTILEYHECSHPEGLDPIRISIYPDIEYKLEIGISAKHEYKGKKEDDSASAGCSVKFTVTYNSIEKELGLEYENEQKIKANSKNKKSTLFYKTLCLLAKAFGLMHKFTKSFADIIEDTYGKKNSLTNDVRCLQKGAYRLSRNLSWLSGSLEINPQISLSWKYHVSDDLTELKRFIEVDLALKGEGGIKVDLIELSRVALRMTKNATTAGVVIVSAGTGGLAALPSILVKFLVDYVVAAITDWLSEPFKAELSIGMEGTFRNLKFNTIEKNNIKASLELKPKIKLYFAIEAKVTVVLFSFVEVESEAKVYTESEASFTICLNVVSSGDKIEIEQTAEIDPLKISIGYEVLASWKLINEGDSNNNGSQSVPEEEMSWKANYKDEKVWTFGGCKLEPHYFILFDNNA